MRLNALLYDTEKGNEIMALQIAYAQFAIAIEKFVQNKTDETLQCAKCHQTLRGGSISAS